MAARPLIDVHAHFYHAESGRADWQRVNDARMRAGDAMGVTYHVVSVLGSYGHTSPTYFPSPADVTLGNDAMIELYGPVVGVNCARKHVGWYTRGLHGSAEFRNAFNRVNDPKAAKAMLHDFYGPSLRRIAA